MCRFNETQHREIAEHSKAHSVHEGKNRWTRERDVKTSKQSFSFELNSCRVIICYLAICYVHHWVFKGFYFLFFFERTHISRNFFFPWGDRGYESLQTLIHPKKKCMLPLRTEIYIILQPYISHHRRYQFVVFPKPDFRSSCPL